MRTAIPSTSAPHERQSAKAPLVALVEVPRYSPAPPIAQRAVYAMKTTIDYTLAPLILVLSLPILLIAIALVRLTSFGPAIYRQQRVGLCGREFTIYKIRTMFHECEKDSGIQWSSGKSDFRITPIGHILRALHIDELPQLINVLKGEMSLVGPRPERPEIVEDLRVSVYLYDRRHEVKPGLTGFAQVHLPPDANILTVKNKLIYDRYYIGRVSFWLDMKILCCTALKVVGMKMLYCRPPKRSATPAQTEE